MKKLVIGLAVVLASQGCSSASSRQYSTSAGEQAYRIECEGLSPCFDKAGDICGSRGYTVIEQSGGPGANMSTLLIRCR